MKFIANVTDIPSSINLYIPFHSEGYDALTESFECRRCGAGALKEPDARDLSSHGILRPSRK